ncbi:HD-GYP domain-containing protein [Bacillus sp. FJAT-45350]|uniref:HD-GYP domain-containing protein n=1 Tax=Bacillus sp. FJAT-45350 TaxID=2011014 RepID=UPI000BB99BA6|nr:HD domain-containing phosphohydrolase [Bacillus sp. FJAT-45350]
MKYTLIDSVEQGDYLGKHIYASDGRVLLHAGVQLTIGLISKLRHMGVNAVFLRDERLEDIEIEEVVSEKTKRETMTTLTASYQYIQSGKEIDSKALNKSVSSIIDEILSNENILLSLTDIRTQDNQLFVHSVNVCITSVIIGVKIGLDKTKLQELAVGALLHDVGKTLPDSPNAIVSKDDGDLNHHSWKGFNALRKNKEISTLSSHVALTHHEHVDGTGEPRNLIEKDIHLLSKIVSVANFYDNLLAPTDGSNPMHPYDACEHIMGLTEKHFSHPVVWRFLRAVAFYPTGSQVRLSTKETGVVVGQHTGLPQRPIVRTFKMIGSSNDDYEIKEVDLAKETTVFIQEIIS